MGVSALHLLTQKLLAPVIHEKVIIRPRLINSLTKSEANAVILSAPAGFGKTVLLLQIVQALERPTVWFQLDIFDNDPAVFWRYLISGCQKHHSGFGIEILYYLNNNQPSINRRRTVVSMLINELGKFHGGVTFIFDDFHIIYEQEIKQFIEELIAHLPTNAKILLAGRTGFDGLERMLCERRIVKISAEELSFNHGETKSCINKNQIQLSAEELEKLEYYTEGWPLAVGMLLNYPGEKSRGKIRDKDLLFSYMASEILTGEEEETRRFLKSIAVWEEMRPEYCDLLLERNDSKKLLADLHEKYFFIFPYGDKSDTYRYHQLFRDYFLEQLGDERKPLFDKAGFIFQEKGQVELAVEYYFIASVSEKAQRIIAREGKKVLGRGDWVTVNRWLSYFSPEEIVANPWLALYKAQIEIIQGHIYAGENMVNHAVDAFSHGNDIIGLAESRLLKAKILRYQGCYRDSLELMGLAIPILPLEEIRERFDIYLEKSYTLMLYGSFNEAESELSEALKQAEQRGDTVLMTYLYEGLGTVTFARGDYHSSMYYCRRGLAISPDKTLRNYYFHDSIGPIFLDWGELDKAYEYLTQSVAAKENFGLTEALPSAYSQLGNALLDRGDLLKAEEYFRKALLIMEEHGGDNFVHTLTSFMLSICLGAQGRLVEAQDLVDKARKQAGNQSKYLNGLFQVVECFFILQTGDMEAAYHRLYEILPMLESVGARKLLCIAYSALALVGISRGNERDISEFSPKAITLAAEMNFVHDFLLSFETYQPLLYLGLERGIEVTFIQRIMVRLGQRSVPLLQKLAEHPDPSVRERVLKPLVQVGGTAAFETIKKPGLSAIKAGKSTQNEKVIIRLCLLGPVRIFFGDKEITHINWIRSKSRDLLIYLAHLGNPAYKDKIIEAFWPDIPYQQANTLFHTNIHNIRHILEKQTGCNDMIIYGGGRYYLAPGKVIIDKQDFQERLAAAGNDGRLNEQSALILEDAVALYRGDYLDELDYTWVIAEQEYFKQLYNKARESLSQYYLSINEFMKAIIHLERLIQDNPLTEEYYNRMMLACAGIGDLKSIKSLFQRLSAVLKDELGIYPSSHTKDLYSRLMNAR